MGRRHTGAAEVRPQRDLGLEAMASAGHPGGPAGLDLRWTTLTGFQSVNKWAGTGKKASSGARVPAPRQKSKTR
jgi:hypothetical protein